jgi:hypothetical protein
MPWTPQVQDAKDKVDALEQVAVTQFDPRWQLCADVLKVLIERELLRWP